MTRDDIIRMAREAGFSEWAVRTPQYLERFAARVEEHLISQGYRKCAEGQRTTQFCGMVEAAREEEREACADICDQHASIEGIAQRCAATIRARGQV